MKSTTKTVLFSVLVAVLFVAGAGQSWAHYDHDSTGWFDKNHHHHAFITHNGHRGYWDTDDNGVKIFINI